MYTSLLAAYSTHDKVWPPEGDEFERCCDVGAVYQKYESEAEAAHGRKQERWGEANDLVSQMGQSEATKFSTMQDKYVPSPPTA